MDAGATFLRFRAANREAGAGSGTLPGALASPPLAPEDEPDGGKHERTLGRGGDKGDGWTEFPLSLERPLTKTQGGCDGNQGRASQPELSQALPPEIRERARKLPDLIQALARKSACA